MLKCLLQMRFLPIAHDLVLGVSVQRQAIKKFLTSKWQKEQDYRYAASKHITQTIHASCILLPAQQGFADMLSTSALL